MAVMIEIRKAHVIGARACRERRSRSRPEPLRPVQQYGHAVHRCNAMSRRPSPSTSAACDANAPGHSAVVNGRARIEEHQIADFLIVVEEASLEAVYSGVLLVSLDITSGPLPVPLVV
jgi:hypothetical protein